MLDSIHEKETLPRGAEDDILPTRIAKLDTHMDFLYNQMDALKKEIELCDVERGMLIARANELHISEDKDYKIVLTPIYPKKHVDVEALKRLAPVEHATIVANLTKKAQDKLQEQMQKIQVAISQADVKAVIGSKALLAQIIPEQTVPSEWKTVIVKKSAPVKK